MKNSQPKDTAVRHQDHIHEEPTKHNTSTFNTAVQSIHLVLEMALKITQLGTFSALPIVLTKKKAAVQSGISHACARPQRDNQAFSTTEKNYP